MVSRVLKLATATAGAVAVLGGGAALAAGGPGAGGPPPPPKATNGHTVTQVAAGGSLGVPTSFAFGAGSIFEGDGGSNQSGPPNGGVSLLKDGTATKIAGSPQFVGGLAWHQGALYISGGSIGATGATFEILKWSGWNGTTFTQQKAIYTAPKKLNGLNGIAFGPNGRLYVGVDVGLTDNNDHGPAKTPYLYDILSMNANGKAVKVYATGMRQPWQFAFSKGSANPLVSDLGQDKPGSLNPPDFLLRVKKGDNYGFPQCNWKPKSKCKGFTKPYKFFAPHTDIMGLAIIGKTLYMTEFSGPGGKGPGGEVVSMPLSGGPLKPVLTGFVAPTVGLGANGGKLYVGELSAQVFSVTP